MAPRRVMPAADLLARAKPVEDLEKSLKADDLAFLRECVGRLFSTEDGRRVLEHLLDVTLRAQGLNPFSEQFGGTAERVAMATAYRAGQNSIVLHLLALAEQAAGKPGFYQKPPI